MAKDSGGMLNILLIGGAAYLAWQWYQGASAPSITGTTPPAGTTTNPPAGTTTTNPPATPTNPVTPTVCPSGTTGTYPNCITPPPPPPPQPPVAKVGKYPYTDKASYQQALVNAVVDAAGGDSNLKQTADQWNWFMVNSVGVNYSPDPTTAMAPGQRFTPITAAVYYDALRYQNMLDYPSGLAGLATLTHNINRINRHPLAQRASGNQFYLKPRKVVM